MNYDEKLKKYRINDIIHNVKRKEIALEYNHSFPYSQSHKDINRNQFERDISRARYELTDLVRPYEDRIRNQNQKRQKDKYSPNVRISYNKLIIEESHEEYLAIIPIKIKKPSIREVENTDTFDYQANLLETRLITAWKNSIARRYPRYVFSSTFGDREYLYLKAKYIKR